MGNPAKTVDESKERLRGAFATSNLQIPRKRIAINLAPADVPKDDSGIDLGTAAAILLAGNGTKIAADIIISFCWRIMPGRLNAGGPRHYRQVIRRP